MVLLNWNCHAWMPTCKTRKPSCLVGGDKAGADQRRFYRRLIALADARFDHQLASVKAAPQGVRHGKKS